MTELYEDGRVEIELSLFEKEFEDLLKTKIFVDRNDRLCLIDKDDDEEVVSLDISDESDLNLYLPFSKIIDVNGKIYKVKIEIPEGKETVLPTSRELVVIQFYDLE